MGVALAPGAQAATLTSGPVTITTTGTVTTGQPYSSGQTLNISVAANSTMDNAALVAAGFPSGAVSIKALECADPGGLVANLPTKPTECDPNTIDSIAGANSDGSMNFTGYTVYALPDSILFGEPTTNTPVCGSGAVTECVIGLFSNQNDFSKPLIFSAPFGVAANADDGGENPGDGSPLAATPVSPTNSTIVASAATAVADGVDGSKVTVTLEGSNGVPVPGGKQVTLDQGSGQSTIMVGGVATDSTTSDPTTGVASFTVTDTNAQAVTYTAADTTDGVTLSASVTVTFAKPVVTPANSTITASPTTVATGGTSTVTVTLKDQAVTAQPVAGKAVTLSDGTGHATIVAVQGTTGASGQATFTVTDSTNEVATFTATDTTDGLALTGQSALVTFGSLTVSGSTSTVTASPVAVSTVASGGVLPTGTITVTLLAADGSSPVAGKTVTLSASSTTAVITPTTVPDVTNASGQATFQVADGTTEVVTFTATDTTDSIPLTKTAQVTFAPPGASAATSQVTVSTTTDPADGVSAATITVTVRDQFGHALAGKMVSVTGAPSATTRVAPQTSSTNLSAGTTDTTGQAVFFAYDTTAETVVYTAVDTTDNVTITQTVSVTFLASLPQSNQSTLSANPLTVPADGTTASTVTVTLDDHNSNPVSGKTIVLAANGGSSVITPSAMPDVTNAKGQATFKVTDSKAEVVFYTATDTTDILPLAGQGVAVTFGTPAPPQPTVADSTIVAAPPQVPADGSTHSTVTVVLSDANGDALSGRKVALNPAGGSSSVATVMGQTDDNGEATFTVTDKTAESVTYSATDVTDDLPITGQSVTVTFSASSTSPTGGQSSTTSTTAATTTTTTPGAPSTTTATTAPAIDAGSATSSGGASTSGGSTSDTAGATLAMTGIPDRWPLIIGLGVFLFFFGSVGRRALRPRVTK